MKICNMAFQNVSVQFFTKPHIKAYLINNFGERPAIDSRSIFHNFLILCLAHSLHRGINEVPEYPEEMRLYISKDDYDRFGCWMNPRQIQLFNQHVDFYMKAVLVAHADTYLLHKQGALLKDALYYSLGELKLSDEEWNIESVTRYYHRSRIHREKFLMYQKENSKKPLEVLSDFKNN